MPGFDKTGPRGQGPLTGGGFGRCRPGPDDESHLRADAQWGIGRGGRPRGGGRGRCFAGGRGGGPALMRDPAADDGPLRSRGNLEARIAELIKENDELRARVAKLEASAGN